MSQQGANTSYQAACVYNTLVSDYWSAKDTAGGEIHSILYIWDIIYTSLPPNGLGKWTCDNSRKEAFKMMMTYRLEGQCMAGRNVQQGIQKAKRSEVIKRSTPGCHLLRLKTAAN
ncbi:unnamed protein product [Wuchereria bancrofti]|uniref:Uncharacterized protein n=1 Tax=Wuchereria bancrofti TaxID=6293 RepID=A0A3P7DR08_WUCBA|nr:unnamed protein product [Wuchereria bancrofti]